MENSFVTLYKLTFVMDQCGCKSTVLDNFCLSPLYRVSAEFVKWYLGYMKNFVVVPPYVH
jgi:hypothetical protein